MQYRMPEVVGRPRTGGRGGRRSGCTAHQCAPCRDFRPSSGRCCSGKRAPRSSASQCRNPYLASELNRSCRQHTHRYTPALLVWSYWPVNGTSVPASRVTRYCCSVSICRHSASLLSIFSLITIPGNNSSSSRRTRVASPRRLLRILGLSQTSPAGPSGGGCIDKDGA
jgi:hypothetical protein